MAISDETSKAADGKSFTLSEIKGQLRTNLDRFRKNEQFYCVAHDFLDHKLVPSMVMDDGETRIRLTRMPNVLAGAVNNDLPAIENIGKIALKKHIIKEGRKQNTVYDVSVTGFGEMLKAAARSDFPIYHEADVLYERAFEMTHTSHVVKKPDTPEGMLEKFHELEARRAKVDESKAARLNALIDALPSDVKKTMQDYFDKPINHDPGLRKK